MPDSPPDKLLTNRVEVSAGEIKPLESNPIHIDSVDILGDRDNSGIVWMSNENTLKDDMAKGRPIYPNCSVSMRFKDLSKVYITTSESATQKVYYAAVKP